ncbi:uncharacterized protein [Arachis hypogaea]|uniref:uncharacterized protein n=1 Tax=Arachis hypogaea TaxID=3818 RepID=UPI003B2165F8
MDLLGLFPQGPDNGTQFTDSKFCELFSRLGIQQIFASVEYPQENGQTKTANKVILKGLKKRLDDIPRSWADELWSLIQHEGLDLIDEVKAATNLAEQALKQRVAKRYNTKVKSKNFQAGALVLKQVDARTSASQGKLALTRKVPLGLKRIWAKGNLDGSNVPRSWNAVHLKDFSPSNLKKTLPPSSLLHHLEGWFAPLDGWQMKCLGS